MSGITARSRLRSWVTYCFRFVAPQCSWSKWCAGHTGSTLPRPARRGREAPGRSVHSRISGSIHPCVVCPLERKQGQAEFLDGREAPHPQQILLQRADEALRDAVAFGLPHEARGTFDAEERDLLLKIVGQVVRPVVVTQPQPTGSRLRRCPRSVRRMPWRIGSRASKRVPTLARNQHDGPRGRVQSLTLAEDAGGVSPGRPSREEDVARPAAEGGPAERPESPPHDLVDRSSEVQPRRRRRGQSLEVDDPLPESFQRDRHTTGTGAVDVRADWRTRRALDEHDLLDVPIVARVARHSRGVVVTADDLCLVQEALMPGWP